MICVHSIKSNEPSFSIYLCGLTLPYSLFLQSACRSTSCVPQHLSPISLLVAQFRLKNPCYFTQCTPPASCHNQNQSSDIRLYLTTYHVIITSQHFLNNTHHQHHVKTKTTSLRHSHFMRLRQIRLFQSNTKLRTYPTPTL